MPEVVQMSMPSAGPFLPPVRKSYHTSGDLSTSGFSTVIGYSGYFDQPLRTGFRLVLPSLDNTDRPLHPVASYFSPTFISTVDHYHFAGRLLALFALKVLITVTAVKGGTDTSTTVPVWCVYV